MSKLLALLRLPVLALLCSVAAAPTHAQTHVQTAPNTPMADKAAGVQTNQQAIASAREAARVLPPTTAPATAPATLPASADALMPEQGADLHQVNGTDGTQRTAAPIPVASAAVAPVAADVLSVPPIFGGTAAAKPAPAPQAKAPIVTDAQYQLATRQMFAGVLLALLLATIAGRVLRHRGPDHGPVYAVIRNYNARVRDWWWIGGGITLALLLGKTGLVLLFGMVSFYALREFISLLHTRRADHWAIAASFFIVLPLQYVWISAEWYGLFTLLIPVYTFLLLPILSALREDHTRFLERTAKVQWGLMVCVYCISHVPALLTLNIEGYAERNILLIAFLVLVVQASDISQYLTGQLFKPGKPLLPRLLPDLTHKTALAGLATAVTLGVTTWWMTPFTLWQSALIAAILAISGLLGSLVMAAIKRDRGIDDWGHIIPGGQSGGMLDKLSSVVFSAPVFFHILQRWWVPGGF